MIAIIMSVIIIAYVLLIIAFWLGWEKSQPCRELSEEPPSVSIIIAVRNEEENIVSLLTDISQQAYPLQLLEVVIVDDHSTDATVRRIQEFSSEAAFSIVLDNLRVEEGKKAAINKAVALSKNEIILTTDGDCRADTGWISSMTSCFGNADIQLVSGPVRMPAHDSFWQRIQSIEFSSLISAGAATLTLGWPTMANADNLAYRKAALEKVNLQEGQNTSSGDDIFLLHEIGRIYNNGVVFCRDQKAIIDTESASVISLFFNQRKRWAGKWQFYYDMPTILLAVFVFFVNLAVLSLPLLVFFNRISLLLAANLFVVKFVFEYLFLKEVQKFFNSKILLHEFIILDIIYPAYVTLVALAGLGGTYIWKDRKTR
jgi:biofilm PGA synthesis N-glycosyltransferase PgaC